VNRALYIFWRLGYACGRAPHAGESPARVAFLIFGTILDHASQATAPPSGTNASANVELLIRDPR
jgi:hypothetical protein